MDDRCIIVYDSGVGGLTVLKQLKKSFPSEIFVYFADYKNLPYGNKKPEQLYSIVYENIKKLNAFSPKLIIFACNTISTNFLDVLKGKNSNIMGIKPNIPNGKTLLMCSSLTASSLWMQKKMSNPSLTVLPMPNLAEQIENNLRGGKTPDLSALRNFSEYEYVSLGCTHYPFISSQISKIFPSSTIVDGYLQLETEVKSFLEKHKRTANGEVCFVGKNSEFLSELFSKM